MGLTGDGIFYDTQRKKKSVTHVGENIYTDVTGFI